MATMTPSLRNHPGGTDTANTFNMEVDSVVWHWLYMKVEDDTVINDGLGHAIW